MRNRVLLAVTFLELIGAIHAGQASAQSLGAAVLPSSRSVQVGSPATAFATIINSGNDTALSVSIKLQTNIPATLTYQTTDPQTNALTGSPNTPVNIPGRNGSQSFLISITPTAPIVPTDVAFNFTGTNTSPAPTIVGVNTLLLSASINPVPDVIALSATLSNPPDGIVKITNIVGTGAFAVASSNVGAGASITVSADTGNATLPVVLSLCQTNPQNGQCTSAVGPTVTTQINAGGTPTFSVFLSSNAFIPFDPANNRIFVRFKDGQGVTRGSTSVAVQTNLVGTYEGSGTVTLSSCRLPPNNGTFSGSFTAEVDSQVGNTISGTFTLESPGLSQNTRVPFTVEITPSGNFVSTTVSFTVTVAGVPIGSGTATLTGQITGNTITANFSGQLQGLENCNVTGSGTATRT
jgi:hypothetical protein